MMSTSLKDNPQIYPLLSKDDNDHVALVDAYAALNRVLEDGDQVVAGHLRRLIPDLTDRLNSVRDLLTRKSYRIGFIGPFQVGKTTAVNRVLGLTILAEGGAGKACTSIATVIELQQDPMHRPDFKIRYFSEPELTRRFRTIAEHPDIMSPVTDLPRKGSPEEGRFRDWAKGQKKKEGLNFLLRLLDEYHSAPVNLFDSSSEWVCCDGITDSDQKDDLQRKLSELVTLRVGSSNDGSGSDHPLLVKDVTVRIRIPDLPAGLELIDLPGLGTFHAYDTELTKSYTRNLDGLLLFSESSKGDPDDIPELLREFRQARKTLTGRIYRIITKMDEVGRAMLYQGIWFATVTQHNKEYEIDPRAVRFLCQKAKHGGEVIDFDKIPRDHRSNALCIESNGNGFKAPEASDYELYHEAFSKYAEDGGRAAVEFLVESEVRETVGNAVRIDAAADLRKLCDDVIDGIRDALRGGFTDDDRNMARFWRGIFRDMDSWLLPGAIDPERKDAAPLFEECWKKLRLHVTVDNVRNAQNIDRRAAENDEESQEWVDLHEDFAAEVRTICRTTLPKVTESFFDRFIKRLQNTAEKHRAASGDSDNGTSDHFDPVAVMNDHKAAVAKSIRQFGALNDTSELQRDLDQLESTELIRNDVTGKLYLEITPEQYVIVMRRKVEAFAYQQLARIRHFIQQAASKVKDRLKKITESRKMEGGMSQESKDAFDSALKDLDSVNSKLSAIPSLSTFVNG